MKDVKDIQDLGITGVFIPAHNYNKLKKYIDKITERDKEAKDNGEDGIIQNLSEEKRKLYLAYISDYSKLLMDDQLYTAIQDMTNEPIVDKQKIEIRDISKKLPGKTMNNGKTKNISFSFLGIAIPVEIPLWHSGFRILIDLTEPTERVKLINTINNTLENVGVNSLGLIYSNEAVVIEKIIWEFIEDKIVGTTAKVKSTDKLRELIDYRDFPFILNGLVKSITPKGFEVKIPCNNNLEDDENGKPLKCGNLVFGTIDANELLRVAVNKFPDNGKQLGIKVLDSISIADIKKYQEELNSLYNNDKFLYELDNDNTIEIKFKFPSIHKRFKLSDMWLAEISEAIDEVIATTKDNDEKARVVDEIIQYMLIGFYVHMIDSITYNGDTKLTGDKDIFLAVKALSGTKLRDKILTDIKTFINNNVYSAIGIPAIRCSKCNKIIGENINEDIKEIIPLNLINIFFSLSVYLDIKTS